MHDIWLKIDTEHQSSRLEIYHNLEILTCLLFDLYDGPSQVYCLSLRVDALPPSQQYFCRVSTCSWLNQVMRIKCLAQGHNTVSMVGFKPTTSNSQPPILVYLAKPGGMAYQYIKVFMDDQVVCYCHLLKCLRSLLVKQCKPRSDCSYREV